MAESEETPETNVEEVEAQAAPEEEATEASAPATTETRKERNAAKRKAKAKPAGPRTLEDRLAERAAHRARNATQRRAYRAKQKTKRAELRKARPAAEAQQAPEHGPGKPKVRQGVVISDKAEKTIVVRVDITRRHRRYHKILRSSISLHVHDERNDAHAGDTVRVQECRPMSRTKRWRLLEVLERAR
jgi:small subunit ribosomal protein S17